MDRFLGELAKRALGWPKHHSNTAAFVALDMKSIRSRLLIAKLRFLKRRMTDDDGVAIGGEAMRALSDDVDSLCLHGEGVSGAGRLMSYWVDLRIWVSGRYVTSQLLKRCEGKSRRGDRGGGKGCGLDETCDELGG